MSFETIQKAAILGTFYILSLERSILEAQRKNRSPLTLFQRPQIRKNTVQQERNTVRKGKPNIIIIIDI